jgi:hypothetical protein
MQDDPAGKKSGISQMDRFAAFLERCKKFKNQFFSRRKGRRRRTTKKPNLRRPDHIENSSVFASIDESISVPDVCEIEHEETLLLVDRLKHFGRQSGGFHSTFDTSKCTELKIIHLEKTLKIETVTDIHTGLSVRADSQEFKPAGYQFSMDSMIKSCELSISTHLPLRRMASLFSTQEHPIYASQFERAHNFIAELGLYPYLALINELAGAEFIQGDDMPTRVIETEKKDPNATTLEKDPNATTLEKDPNASEADIEVEVENSVSLLVTKTAEELGHTHPRSDGKGNKKRINVSLAIGRSDQSDPYSTIVFYRTHRGHLGDLLHHILQNRIPKRHGDLTILTDLSSSNMARLDQPQGFSINQAGCSAHARRPFFRYRTYDEDICYFFLRAFALLYHIEECIRVRGATKETILHYRKKYSSKVWDIIKGESQAILDGKNLHGNIWPPGSKPHGASRYVVDNFEALTRYLTDIRLGLDNNRVERLLRPEKLLLNGCGFRDSERGRVVFDILRTLIQTCRAAGVSFREYMKWLYRNRNQLNEDTGCDFTPLKYRHWLASLKEKILAPAA